MGRVVRVTCAVCVALAACPLERARAAGSWGWEQMASGLGELSRSSRTCVRNAMAVHVYEDLYAQGQIGALSLHSYIGLAARLRQNARFTVRRWTRRWFHRPGVRPTRRP